MTNDLLDKLIKKINFEHANNFELAVAKEYSFVPINVQGESFFVAVSPEANKEKIIEYIKPIVNKKIEFIFLSKQNFDTLFEGFLKKFSSTFGSVLSEETATNPFGDVAFENKHANKEESEPILLDDSDDDTLELDDEDFEDESLDDSITSKDVDSDSVVDAHQDNQVSSVHNTESVEQKQEQIEENKDNSPQRGDIHSVS